MTSLVQKLTDGFKRIHNDTSGAVLFYVTATLPVIVGMALLAIDASRLTSLHSGLQKGTDGLAIAAAGELDRFPDAMARAELAVANLLKNRQTFSTTPGVIDDTDVTVQFYASLPATDADAMGTALDKTDPDNDFIARFVEVTTNTNNYGMNSIFPASFLGGSNSAFARTTSVAGMDQAVCRLAPMFICNPYESDTNTDIHETASIIAGSKTRAQRRRQVRLRSGPGGDGYGPGNWGFLNIPGNNGASDLQDALALGVPEQCFIQSGVDTKPGQNTGPVKDGLNTRFGLYKGKIDDINHPDTDWRTRPAQNVRMGQLQPGPGNKKLCEDYQPIDPETLNGYAPTNGMGLPRDPVFYTGDPAPPAAPGATGPCAGGGNTCEWRIAPVGTPHPTPARWQEYMSVNHPASYPATLPSIAAVAPPITHPAYQAEGEGTWGTVTRYEVYKWEINALMINEQGVSGEIGNPQTSAPSAGGNRCYSGPALPTAYSADDDRRLLNVALVNCRALAAAGNDLNGNQKGVPVAAFVEFFMTEPLEKGGSGNAGDILAEFVKYIAPGNANSVARDQVQLYR